MAVSITRQHVSSLKRPWNCFDNGQVIFVGGEEKWTHPWLTRFFVMLQDSSRWKLFSFLWFIGFFFFFFTFGKFEYQHCLIFSAHLVDFHFLLRLFGLLLVVNMFKAMSGSCSPFREKQLFYSESPVMHCSYLLCSLCLNKQNKIHQSSTVVSLRVCGLVSILAFLP